MLCFRSTSFIRKWDCSHMGALCKDGYLCWLILLHLLLMLHLPLIQGQAVSHINFTLSSMTTLPQCHIFALALYLYIGWILSFHLPQLRCILKSMLEPGNLSLTWILTAETSLRKINHYLLLIKIARETNAELCCLVKTNNNLKYLLQISLVLKKRSIPLLLCLTVLKIYGTCQHQSILIPVDYLTQPEPQF
jgi:hypothetical protein